MATVEEVLSVLADIDYLHDNIQFVIDENLRIVSVPTNGNVIGVVGDHNVNRVNFKMPRYYNGFDMSTFKVRINYENVIGETNYYTVNDLTIEDDYMLFTWLVANHACVSEGTVTFSVRMFKKDNNTIIQEFNTTIASGRILPTIDAYNPGLEEDDNLNDGSKDIISEVGSGSSLTSIMDAKIQECILQEEG